MCIAASLAAVINIFLEVSMNNTSNKTGQTFWKKFAFYLLPIICFICFALVFPSCDNTALDNTPPGDRYDIVEDADDGGQYEEEPGPDAPLTARSFRVIDAVSGFSLDEAVANAVVATLSLPTREGPWAAELPTTLGDNRHFELRDPEDGEETEDAVTKEVVIKTVALGLESYTLRVRIYHTSTPETTFCYKTIRFAVTDTPAPFAKAPSVVPHITGINLNKLTVSWSSPSGAKGFRVYVGTDPEPRPATASGDITDLAISSTDIEGLSDGTTYYVWVSAYNASGETVSPRASRTTTASIPTFFYNQPKNAQGKDFVSWDSFTGGSKPGEGGVDFYIVTPPNEENPSPYMQYGPERGGRLFGYKGDIAYHVAFDPAEAAILAPHTQYGKYGERLDNLPAGVFIVRYNTPLGTDEQRIYQGVYYWGMGRNNGTSVYFSNSYGMGAVKNTKPNGEKYKFAGNPETATLERAIDRFTLENMDEFIAYVAVPWGRNYKPYDWME
jgi:hypothetical protein